MIIIIITITIIIASKINYNIYNYIYIHMYLNPWFLTHRPFPSSPVRSRRPNANLLPDDLHGSPVVCCHA